MFAVRNRRESMQQFVSTEFNENCVLKSVIVRPSNNYCRKLTAMDTLIMNTLGFM